MHQWLQLLGLVPKTQISPPSCSTEMQRDLSLGGQKSQQSYERPYCSISIPNCLRNAEICSLPPRALPQVHPVIFQLRPEPYFFSFPLTFRRLHTPLMFHISQRCGVVCHNPNVRVLYPAKTRKPKVNCP